MEMSLLPFPCDRHPLAITRPVQISFVSASSNLLHVYHKLGWYWESFDVSSYLSIYIQDMAETTGVTWRFGRQTSDWDI
jgi:hypothetical protein